MNTNEPYFKQKIRVLAEIIDSPTVGHLLPDELVAWCDAVGLKTETHSSHGIMWKTVSGE